MVAGREDVRQHGEVVLELVALGQLQAVEVGEGQPQVLRLAAGIRAHRDVAVGAASKTRIDGQAKPVLLFKQFLQKPQATLNGSDTRSPFFTLATPGPTSSTTPMFS